MCYNQPENEIKNTIPLTIVSKGIHLAKQVHTCNVGDLGSIPAWGRSPGEMKGYSTPVFWPGEFYRLYSPWGRKESDTTEQLSLADQTSLYEAGTSLT